MGGRLSPQTVCERVKGGLFSQWGIVCCPSTCGECGGEGCSSRPGGWSSCCSGGVTNTSPPRSCLSFPPPCVVPEEASIRLGIHSDSVAPVLNGILSGRSDEDESVPGKGNRDTAAEYEGVEKKGKGASWKDKKGEGSMGVPRSLLEGEGGDGKENVAGGRAASGFLTGRAP